MKLHFMFCHVLLYSLSARKEILKESRDHFGRSSNGGYDTIACLDIIMSSRVSL